MTTAWIVGSQPAGRDPVSLQSIPAMGFYFDHQISSTLVDRVIEAQHQIIVVSPWVQPWAHLHRALLTARERGVRLTLYYRANEKNNQMDFINSTFHRAIPVERLHAKIYMFDDRILVSSMNLLDSSQQESREIALEIADEATKESIRSYVGKLASSPAVRREIGQSTKPAAITPPPKSQPTTGLLSAVTTAVTHLLQTQETGFCIRCRNSVHFNVEYPLCPGCFGKWAKYKDQDYQEKHCHRCGAQSMTTKSRPLCPKCYRDLVAKPPAGSRRSRY